MDYITDQLKNPMAADRLIDAVEAAIYRRLDNPEGFEEYNSAKDVNIRIIGSMSTITSYSML